MKPMAEVAVLCPAADIPVGQIRAEFLPDGVVIALYNVDGTLYATEDACTHGAASLSEDGTLHGCEVECSFHNGRFNVTTGQACASPCTTALRTFPVRVVNGMVEVEYR